MKGESAEGIGIEKIGTIGNARGGCTEQPSCGIPSASSPQCHQLFKTAADREYARQMEERYGILDEGAF